jgi:hypothetical protein
MKSVGIIILGLCFTGCAAPLDRHAASISIPPGDWVTCEKRDAEYAVTGWYSIDGLFENDPLVEYFKHHVPWLPPPTVRKALANGNTEEEVPLEPFSVLGTMFVDGRTAQGEGWGYNADIRFSQAPSRSAQAFELYFRIQWDKGTDRGGYEHTFYFDRLSDASVKYRRLRVNFVVKKIPPNQSPLPIPPSVTPPAGAPVPPPTGAASH